ncbi:MAG: DUF3540 domain-containing protein [Sandaracinaceae bacterium]
MHAMLPVSEPSAVARGEVIADAGSAALVRLRDGRTVRVGVCLEHDARVGDELVVARDADGWFSVGTLRRAPRPEPREPVEAPEEVARRLVLEAAEKIELRVGGTSVELDPERLQLTSARAEVAFGDTLFTGKTVVAAVERARHVAGVLETEAQRLVTRAKETYQDVEDVALTRAGRIRQLATGALHLFGGRAVIRADDDVAIDGKKIHLG